MSGPPAFDTLKPVAYPGLVSVPVESARKIWTEAELEALPEDGFLHEVVNGELVMSPKNSFFHGDICMRVSSALSNFASQHRLGVVLDSSTGFWMQNRNCRAPDISFVTRARILKLGFKRRSGGFFPGAPDLAVEILSRHNSRYEIDQRLKDFFASGTQITWIINPEPEAVEICHSPIQRQLIGPGAALVGEQLLPGFQYAVRDLFKDWDWE